MKRCEVTLLFIILILSIHTVKAQSKYGQATLDELKMTEYSNDTSAVAVILLKNGNTRFIYGEQTGFQFEYTLQMKIKILKNEGLEYCNQQISYYQPNRSTGEKIIGLNGTTYNLENDKIVKDKLSKDLISDEKIDDKWNIKKFTMPAAKVGSIIEFKYTLVSDYFYDLREFSFQSSIPTEYVFFQIVIPQYFYYNTNMQGYEPIQASREPVNETFRVIYKDNAGRTQMESVRCSAEEMTFVGRNLPAIRNESYLWSINNYINKVSFELNNISFPWSTVKSFSTTWENIDEELLKLDSFGGNTKKTGMFKDIIEKGDLTLEKAKAIQSLIKNKVAWNERDRLLGSDLKKVWNDGSGNSADMNFLLINALNAAGFEAYPVVLSTRSNGNLPVTHPSVSALNYTITALQLDTVTFYTDASSKYGDWNILPEKCMVDKARLVKKDRSSWIDLSHMPKSTYLITSTINFKENQAVCATKTISRNNAAYDFRNLYYQHENEEDFIQKQSSKLSGNIEDFKITGLEETDKDIITEFTLKKDIESNDEFFYFNPLILNTIKENPFKKEERKFPINFNYPYIYRQIIQISIPEGYVVDELPESVIYNYGENDDITFSYRIAQNNESISIQYTFQVNTLIILPGQYAHLRDLFSKIILKDSEQIVFKKI